MNIELIETCLNGEKVNSVNSREIYDYLQIGAEYATWIKRAIDKYDFEIGIDFDIFVKPTNNKKDYIVSLDMAKELCMVSNTEKGKETRKYFIDIEKNKNKPLTYEQVMQNALLIADKKVKELEYKIEIDKPKVSFASTVESSLNSVLIGQWAKSINLKEKDVRIWLNEKKYIYRDSKLKWTIYATEKVKQYFELVPSTNSNQTGTHLNYTVKIKGEGQIALTDKVLKDLGKNNG